MNSNQKNLVSVIGAFILASVVVLGFNVDLFSWVGEPSTLDRPSRVTAVVINVIDGDTFIAQIGTSTESVRLIGVDAPEITWPSAENDLTDPEPECYGFEAKEALTDYVQDAEVELLGDKRQPDYDDYDRRLAYVYIDGELVNEKLLIDGYTRELSVGRGYDKRFEFRQAEAMAQEADRGLWVECR